MTPEQAARELDNRISALKRQQKQAEDAAKKQAIATAVKHSSGNYSLLELRRRGHPYARRNPRPPADPAILNAQSKRLQRSWRVRFRTEGGKRYMVLYNISPEAVFLDPEQQTSANKQIARPIAALIQKELTQSFSGMFVSRFKEALKL